jgi:hypothetical protein
VRASAQLFPDQQRVLLAELQRLGGLARDEPCRRLRSQVLGEVYQRWGWRTPGGVVHGLLLTEERLRDLGTRQDPETSGERYKLSFYRAELLFMIAERKGWLVRSDEAAQKRSRRLAAQREQILAEAIQKAQIDELAGPR